MLETWNFNQFASNNNNICDGDWIYRVFFQGNGPKEAWFIYHIHLEQSQFPHPAYNQEDEMKNGTKGEAEKYPKVKP